MSCWRISFVPPPASINTGFFPCRRHKHTLSIHNNGGEGGPYGDGGGAPNAPIGPYIGTAKTGISIENLPAKSAVSVSVDANDAGEHLPLAGVCAHLPEGRLNTTPIS